MAGRNAARKTGREREPAGTMAEMSIDTYLALCVRACLEHAPIPPWPDGWMSDIEAAAAARIKFHGIALLLLSHDPSPPRWPEPVLGAVRDEARMQALWEASHHAAVGRLVERFAAAGVLAAAMKGTAVGYGHHPDPALRRRGDTDLLLPHADRAAARAVLRASGFTPSGDAGPTQEPWSFSGRDGFTHEVDIHWRISSTPAVAKALERMACETRLVPLPRLAPSARALGDADNLILTCVNRFAHQSFGYRVEDGAAEDGDRLIWAVDLRLLTARFGAGDWDLLARLAAAGGVTGLVHSGLAFARDAVGLALPPGVLDLLAEARGEEPVAAYLGERSSLRRLRLDMKAATSGGELAALLRLRLWPGRRFLAERYPQARHWPIWALRIRRLVGGLTRRLGLPT